MKPLLLLIPVLLVSCNSVREKASILSESGDQLTLETERVEYFFMPEATRAASKAKRHYTTAAQAEAKRRGKQIKRVRMLDAEIDRRELSGTYFTRISGVVELGQGWNGIAEDYSPLMGLASRSETSSHDRLQAAAGISAGMAATNAAIAQQNAASMQAIQMSQVNSSIRANTNAVNNLNQTLARPVVSPVPVYRPVYIPSYR